MNTKATRTARPAGFTLVEIMIVVAIIGLLSAIAIPNFLRARATTDRNACIENLRQIDGAKQQWALENGGGAASTPTANQIQPYLGRGAPGNINSVYCPLDPNRTFATSYSIGDLGTAPICKINGNGQVDPGQDHKLP